MKTSLGSKQYYRAVCAAILTIIAAGMFFFVWYRFVTVHNQTGHLTGAGNLIMVVGIYVVLLLYFGHIVRAFKIGVERKASTVASVLIALFLVDFAEIFLSLAITGQFRFFWNFFWRYVLLYIYQASVDSVLATLMIDLYRKLFPPFQILEIYGDYADSFYDEMNTVYYKYHVSERCHYSDESIESRIPLFDAVLINDIPAEIQNDILKACFSMGKRVYFVPKISDIIVKASEELNLFDTPLYMCRNEGLLPLQRLVKRTFDVVSSFLALIVLSPLLLVTALAIKLNDGGSVFYKQERCTIGGKRFMILKFRSMIVDAEKDGRTHPAGEHDDRITKVGRIIRATRIDELPQLINILKGDMSVVGPRPERVEHVQIYTEQIPEFVFRSKVKGGLTGYAQVYGKYNTSALDKLKMDLVYITNYSLMLDFQIILETLKILLRKESTEGFSESKAAEMHDHVIQ